MEKSQRLEIESRLTKMEAINESNYLSVGDSFTGFYYDPPKVGETFVFFCDGLHKIGNRFSSGPFSTSTVMEIVDEFSFKTKNTLYYLIDKSKERDQKIEELLQQKHTI
jgi:hypothetical protein